MMTGLCLLGLIGFGLALYASAQTGCHLLHALGIQAVYISSLAVILWRMTATVRSSMGMNSTALIATVSPTHTFGPPLLR
jgi:hypothetical protein